MLLILVVCLGLHGWLLLVNAGYRYDRDLLQFFAVRPRIAAWLPQAIDTVDSLPMMLRLSGLLGVALIAADAARHALWRHQLFWTINISGTLLALYGLIQRFSPIPILYWEQADLSHNLFATYYYHGNAGAFMNLVFPFAFAAAVRGFDREQPSVRRALGAAALFLNLAAAVQIASKAAQVITVVLLAMSVFSYRREIFHAPGPTRSRQSHWIVGAGLAALCVAALALSGDATRLRWALLPRLMHADNARLLAYRASLRMLSDSGPWGIGPGNFSIAFPHYTNGLPEAIMGVWSYAHEDYLQTMIEWGWIGAALWSAIFFGAFWRGRRLLRAVAVGEAAYTEDHAVYRAALLALFGVTLHATVDFPLQVASIQLFVLMLVGLLWHVPATHGPLVADTHRAATAPFSGRAHHRS